MSLGKKMIWLRINTDQFQNSHQMLFKYLISLSGNYKKMYLRIYLCHDNLEVFQHIRSDILPQLERVFVTILTTLYTNL